MPGDQRWIDLDGADNMRDLGGLEVTGGGQVLGVDGGVIPGG
jgi:hypothetical protein